MGIGLALGASWLTEQAVVSAQGAGGSGKRYSGGFHGDLLSLRPKSRFTPTAKTASATKSSSTTKTASALPTSQGQPTLSASTKTLFSLTTMM